MKTRLTACCTAIGIVLSAGFTGVAYADDLDLDGIDRQDDNCELVANASQVDSDGDGWGNACDPDFNNDGTVDFSDFAILADAFGSSTALTDLNSDGAVNFADVAIFTQFFGSAPGPAGFARWVSPDDGDWERSVNWFPQAVPPTEAVLILEQPDPVTIDLPFNDTQTVSGLVVNSDFKFIGSLANLQILGSATVNGNLEYSSRELDIRDELLINGSVVMGRSSIIKNARIVAASEPFQLTSSSTVLASFALVGVTLASDLEVFDADMTVAGGLTLENASITITLADIRIADSIPIDGQGEIRFTGTPFSADFANQVYPTTAAGAVLGDQITLRSVSSGAVIGSNSTTSGPFVIKGPIISDLPERTVTVRRGVRLEGRTTVSNAAKLRFESDWSVAAGGSISASSNAELLLWGTWENSGLIETQDSTVEFGCCSASTWTNAGQIRLLSSDVSIRGILLFDDIGDFFADQPVAFFGTIENAGMSLNTDELADYQFRLNGGARINGGTIVGTQPLTIGPDAGTVTFDNVLLRNDVHVLNNSILQTENGLTLDNTTIAMMADDGFSRVDVRSGGITGSGEFHFAGTTDSIDANHVNGELGPASPSDPSFNIVYRTVTASGKITPALPVGNFNGTILSQVAGLQILTRGLGTPFDASFQASNGGALAFEDNWTLSEEGSIVVEDGFLDLSGDWENLGVISLTRTPLQLGGSFSSTSIGELNTDEVITLTGTMDNTGQTFDTGGFGGAQFEIVSDAKIIGGTVTGTPGLQVRGTTGFGARLEGVTLSNTDINVLNDTNLWIEQFLLLDDATVTLNSDDDFDFPDNLSQIEFLDDQVLSGVGEIIFGGTTSTQFSNRIQPRYFGGQLTIDPDIVVRADTANGRIGRSNRSFTFNGTAIVLRDDGDFNFRGDVEFGGNMLVGYKARLDFQFGHIKFAPQATVNIEIGGDTNGRVTFLEEPALAGTLNLSLRDGFFPLPCQEFQILTFPSATGTFATVNGPDLGGGQTFSIVSRPDSMVAVAPGSGCAE